MTQQPRQLGTTRRKPFGLVTACFVLAAAVLTAPRADARDDDSLPVQERGIRIDDKAGTQLPTDLHFRNQDGRDVTLQSYFDGNRPVVLVLAYYTCPMLCSTVMRAVAQGLKDVAWQAGNQYRIVTVSIDPRDTPATAKAKRAEIIGAYGRDVTPDAWDFLTSDAATSQRLADAIGFHYRWDPEQQQFAHAAGAFVLTAGGKISHVFYGIGFPPNDLRLGLIEASNGRFSSATDRVLLFCFHYDPKEGKYVLAARRLMMAGGVATVLALSAFIGRYLLQETKKGSA